MGSTQHFTRLIMGQSNVLDRASEMAYVRSRHRAPSGTFHTSTSARAIGIPTLGETGMKFRSSRWTQCGAEEGLSVFDVRGAMEAIEKGPEQVPGRRVHPAQLAHAARIARAQQMDLTFYGYKVADIREKMQAALQPYKEMLQSHATSAKDSMTLKERPVIFGHLQEIGQSISHTLGKPKAMLQSSSELETSAHQ